MRARTTPAHTTPPTTLRTRILRAVAGPIVATLVLLSGCTGGYGHGDGEDQPGATSGTVTPTPPPTFAQDFTGTVDGTPAAITVGASIKRKVRPGNLGVSFESTELADPRWDPDASNLDELLRSLGSPALRFGGNRLDRSVFWTSASETPPEGKTAITPDDFTRLKKMLDATGSDVTIGIPLGDYDPERGADMAHNAITILGDHLVGISIGNEPNGYTVDSGDLKIRDDTWDTATYEKQLVAYVDAITKRDPDAPIIGPAAYDTQWMDAFIDGMRSAGHAGNIAAISQHWYALYACDSTAIPGRGPQAENFTTAEVHNASTKILGMGLKRARRAGLPLWVEETGPTSCVGTNDTSGKIAMSLWTADYTLHAAALGVTRMSMHSMLGSCSSGAPMSTVCDPEGGAGAGAGEYQFEARDNFTAMQVIAPTVGGTLLKTAVKGGDNMRAYTTVDGSRLVTVIINNNDAAKTGGNPVTLTAPRGFVPVTAGQLAGVANDTTTPARVVPQRELPDKLPYSGPGVAGGGASQTPTVAPTGAGEDADLGEDAANDATANVLRLDVAASSITTIVWKKQAQPTQTPSDSGQ